MILFGGSAKHVFIQTFACVFERLWLGHMAPFALANIDLEQPMKFLANQSGQQWRKRIFDQSPRTIHSTCARFQMERLPPRMILTKNSVFLSHGRTLRATPRPPCVAWSTSKMLTSPHPPMRSVFHFARRLTSPHLPMESVFHYFSRMLKSTHCPTFHFSRLLTSPVQCPQTANITPHPTRSVFHFSKILTSSH